MGIIFLLLFLKVTETIKDNTALFRLTNVLLLLNFVFGFFCNSKGELFSGMYITNDVLVLEKNILNFGTLLISLLSCEWTKTHKNLAEFYILLLSTLLGMFYMLSANHFLMFYLGLELSTIPLAALANFDQDKVKSSEAAVKMALSSAFASGVTLFGISMVYGSMGTLNFAEVPELLNWGPLQIMAFLFLFAGFAFKLSAVPFHLWTADVYEGSPVPVTAYLSVISKGAMVFVLLNVLYNVFRGYEGIWFQVLFITIIVTIIVGNLFALRQENIKRFLAFSSIAQVGYILLGICSGNAGGAAATLYFIIVYIFSNLGAFTVVALVSAKTGKENINDYRGFYASNPALGWVMALSLFSLAGVPPTAGFFGKMFLVTAGASTGSYILVSIAALNMVVSLYYYLRVVKAMFVEKSDAPIEKLSFGMAPKVAMAICVIGIVTIGFAGCLLEYITNLFQ